MTWYVIDHTIYARRGDDPHDRDPVVAVASTTVLAEEIAFAHNLVARIAHTQTLNGAGH